ncbi:hypothetical protein LGQ02_17690 [Bacillus shivajii]|uniref:hypothetical protein n=1 Tax=Bacillus shivajii TaxID=1983719 RepID=UPI001CFA6857|nr:hypothetical protein [Bacillus shivajii]UCZ52620.1 hypothetical protein LGQ02_17690 [Bacillus shivajii]
MDRKKGNRFAKWSFTLGVISFFSYFFLGPLNFILNIIGILLGAKGYDTADQFKSTAKAGIILHTISCILYLFYFLKNVYPWL